jgi:hypothetical protein
MTAGKFNSPEQLYDFIEEVIRRLQAKGHDAKPLQDVQSTAYTTSSEWLGELGVAVRRVLKQKIEDELIIRDLNRIVDTVHKVWPKL